MKHDKRVAYYVYISGLSVGVAFQIFGLILETLSKFFGAPLASDIFIIYGLYVMQVTPLILLTTLTVLYLYRGDKVPALASLLGLIAIILVIAFRLFFL